MDPLWLSLSLLHDGLPTISPILVTSGMFLSQIDIRHADWPTRRGEPLVASRKSQLINYGDDHYQVCIMFHMSILIRADPTQAGLRGVRMTRISASVGNALF
jgi:hypothetical protein